MKGKAAASVDSRRGGRNHSTLPHIRSMREVGRYDEDAAARQLRAWNSPMVREDFPE
jgi:hypothetical protein